MTHIKISLYPYAVTASLPIAELFQALSDPSRVRILMLLRTMELSVGELAQVLGQSQPRVSRHVRILGDAGLLDRHKEGSWVFLALTGDPRTETLFSLIDQWLDPASREMLAADAVRLAAVRADRAEAAARYFSAHAEVWDSIRSLHVAESAVEKAVEEALAVAMACAAPGDVVVFACGSADVARREVARYVDREARAPAAAAAT